jgi:hypothetical protein
MARKQHPNCLPPHEPNHGLSAAIYSPEQTFAKGRYVTKESFEGDEVSSKDGGSTPPAITYNDEVEDMVNDMCKSKYFRDSGLSDQVAEVCQSMIGVEAVKRKIVAMFLVPPSSPLFPPFLCHFRPPACGRSQPALSSLLMGVALRRRRRT